MVPPPGNVLRFLTDFAAGILTDFSLSSVIEAAARLSQAATRPAAGR
jgi:hypothetical protein